jgi:hypothetical protein
MIQKIKNKLLILSSLLMIALPMAVPVGMSGVASDIGGRQLHYGWPMQRRPELDGSGRRCTMYGPQCQHRLHQSS